LVDVFFVCVNLCGSRPSINVGFVVFVGGNIEQITGYRKVGKSVLAMEQPNAGAAGANGEVPQDQGAAVADGALQLVNEAVVLPQVGGARGRAAGQAPLLVNQAAGPTVADVAGPFDVEGVLLGPLPRKSNRNCKILPKIADETGP